MAVVRIRTAQNVIVEHNIASPADRVLGSLIDGMAIFVYFFGLMLIITALFSNNIVRNSEGIARGFAGYNYLFLILIFIFAIPVVFYSLIFEIFFNGQSLGKMAMKTRVVRLDGGQPTIGNYFTRWILRIVDFGIMNGAIALICVAASDKGQRLGDMAAGTTVIKITRKTSLADTLPTFNDSTYEPKFPEAANLTDEQANIIKEALRAYRQEDNYVVVDALSRKLRELLHIQTNMPPLSFLETILKDYSHLHNIR